MASDSDTSECLGMRSVLLIPTQWTQEMMRCEGRK